MNDVVILTNIIKILFVFILMIPLYISWNNKHKIGRTPLFLLILFTISYTFIHIIINIHVLSNMEQFFELLSRPIGIGIVLSSFYLAIEYTGHKLNTKETLRILILYFIFCLILFITNPTHNLLYSRFAIGKDGYLIPVETDLLFFIYILPTSIFVVTSIFIIYRYSLLYKISRRQSMIIGIGMIIGYISISIESVTYTFHQAINLDVLGINIGVIIICISIIYFDLINNIPLTKSDIIQNIDNTIISITPSRDISDIQNSEKINIDINKNNIGDSIEDIFEKYNVNINNIIENSDETFIKLNNNNNIEYYNISSYTVKRNVNVLINRKERMGHIIVVKNITDKKKSEEQIKLLNNIFGRILRHNMRNELNVIKGHANIIKNSSSNNNSNINSVNNSVNSLINISNKAQKARKVIDNIDSKNEFNTNKLIKSKIYSISKKYPETKFNYEIDESFNFTAHTKFDTLIDEIITNGIKHNDSKNKKITIKSEVYNKKQKIIISDNGKGIPDSELKPIFNENKETPLEHGSSLGLWLIKFIIDISNKSISFNTDKYGTTVEIICN